MRKLISLYTGCGGLDLGFEAAGFETAVAVEMDSEAVATLRFNRGWPVIHRDIHAIPSSELLAVAGLRVGEADALIGGPPCQPFSKSGYWVSGETLRLDDSRAGTLGAYLRVLRDTLPRTFLLENVPGLAYQGKSEGLDLITGTLRKINQECGTHYNWAVAQLDAADYGVPQMRQRVFVVGAREGTEFSFPTPTHAAPEALGLDLGLRAHTTAWDAIGDLEASAVPETLPRGKWAKLLPSVPEGENYLWHTERGGGLPLFGWRRRYWSFLLKLAKNLPSWTIQAQPGPAVGPFHWKNRRLTARELCRLQTVPEDFSVLGSLGAVQRQLGNAVPSALAEVLALAMRRQLLGEDVRIESRLIPAPRRPVPSPEPVLSVAMEEYGHLVGNHLAHPGTGRGYAASRRKWQQNEASEAEPRLAFA
jgi:DNA (cytosine-5)-methyltransferase 1